MRYLVTGAAGFIGSNFVKYILDSSEIDCKKLVVLDCLTYAGCKENLKEFENDDRFCFVNGDIGNISLIESILNEYSINGVINFAAESHVDRSIDSPELFFQTNVIGTLRLIDTCKIYWQENCPEFRFLHVSTDEVYGSLSANAPAFTEKNNFEPNSPYSASKASSDHIIRSYYHTYGMPVITTNCSNNYGPMQFPEKLIPLITLNAIDGSDLPIYGDGLNIRDWLYVTDHCEAIHLVLEKGILGETYNIGGMNELTNIEIIDNICSILDNLNPRVDGKSYKSQKIHVRDRPGHDKRYAIDCSKIINQLGWSPKETFESGIIKTITWYLNNGEWCDAITEKKYNRKRLGGLGL